MIHGQLSVNKSALSKFFWNERDGGRSILVIAAGDYSFMVADVSQEALDANSNTCILAYVRL